LHLTLVDRLVWAASFLLNLTLLLVLILRHRTRSVPWFTAWIAFGSLRTVALFLTYRLFAKHTYFLVYWWAAGFDLVLQVAVVLEIARSVFRRSGSWVPEARRRFLIFSSFAPITGVALALMMKPSAKTALDAWDARANLFMTVLICVMSRAVMAVSKQLGLGWKSGVTQMTWGLLVWSVCAFVTDTLHSYWRTIDDFGSLENTIAVIFQLVTVYWIAVFWLPEPVLVAMSGQAKKDLNRLTERLDYGESKRP